MIGSKLNNDEREELLRAPVYISLLASVKDGEIKKSEKETAERITDLRSRHSGDNELNSYYKDVQVKFSEYFERMSTMLPAEVNEKVAVLSQHLERVRVILEKLPGDEREKLKKSFKTLAGRVEKADRNLFQYFFVPFGISEDDNENNYNNQGPETRHYSP